MSRYIFDEDQFEYKGIVYCPCDDIEEDNVKRFHKIYIDHDNIRVDIGSIPLSPYAHLTEAMFIRWIDAGRPCRSQLGGNEPIDHEKYYKKLFDKHLDAILLGDTDVSAI